MPAIESLVLRTHLSVEVVKSRDAMLKKRSPQRTRIPSQSVEYPFRTQRKGKRKGILLLYPSIG